jgi:hypothetical protein
MRDGDDIWVFLDKPTIRIRLDFYNHDPILECLLAPIRLCLGAQRGLDQEPRRLPCTFSCACLGVIMA